MKQYNVIVDGERIECINYADMQYKFFYYKLAGHTVETEIITK